MTLVERLFEQTPGAEQVLAGMKKAFGPVTPILPWFEDIKIYGLSIRGSADLVLGHRLADMQGFGVIRKPDNSKPGLIIYPLRGEIYGLNLTSELWGGCEFRNSLERSALVLNLCFVGDYKLPYYTLLEISYLPRPVN
ncbi:MAG: hypothetical protein Q7K45_07710 [Nanoarchaeota archaeon]|nr:hypothetical protein [Nanoarchaeota archaeon]